MVKTYHSFSKTAYFKNSHSTFKKGQYKHRGRPKKREPIISQQIDLQELISNPSLFQRMDLFSEIAKSLMNFIRKGEKENQKEKYKLFFSNHISPSIFDSKFRSYKYEIIYSHDKIKQKFFEFLSALIQRTKDSLALNEEVSDILINIKDMFCHSDQDVLEETVKTEIWKNFTLNKMMKKKFEKYFNEELFESILNALFKWKRMFYSEFAKQIKSDN